MLDIDTLLNRIDDFAESCDNKGYIEESDNLQAILTAAARERGAEIDLADIYKARTEQLQTALGQFRRWHVG